MIDWESLWGNDSGPGSDPIDARPYLTFLSRYISTNDIKSVLDLGCGDGRLARETDWHSARVVGLDIIYGFDVRTCTLPFANLAIMKDVLQHWPNTDIQAILPRLRKFEHVLLTNCCDPWRTNEDIVTGDARALDLSIEPFNWPVVEVFRWKGHETKSVVRLLT